LLYVDGLSTQPAITEINPNLMAIDRTPSRLLNVLVALLLGLLWFVCCRHLSAEWSYNEQYNYGWFVPFFAIYLFWLRWEDRPKPTPPVWKFAAGLLMVCAALTLLPLRVFEIGSADWRPLGWAHMGAVATITLSLIYLTGGGTWLRHFSFPVLFFFVAVPWITPIEGPIVQNLMRVIAASAAETLGLFGIPAQVEGNLIRLPRGLVGVNEACSGVRSLQTSLMIGLLFGELKRLKLVPRLVLIAGALAIALVANFLRATFLVWIGSSRDLAAISQWHDLAGYAVVVLVFIGTMWIASGWKTARNEETTSPKSGDFPVLPSILYLPVVALLLWVIAVEIGAECWYRIHERNLIARAGWSVRWPESAPGYREIKIDNEVRQQLRFDSGREARWTFAQNGQAGLPPGAAYLFFFRWNPGSGTILRARAHRPDICLPAAGWAQIGSGRLETYNINSNSSLPFQRFDFVKQNSNGQPLRAHAFFTLHEDVAHETETGAAANAGLYSNWDLPDRWRVVRNGIRNRGQQVLEIIIVPPPQADDSTVEQQFAELVPKLIEPAN